MNPSRLSWRGLRLAALLLLFTPLTVWSVGDADQDAAEVGRYELNATGLAKYRQANANLAESAEGLRGNCDNELQNDSLDGMVAQIQGVPGAAAAIQSAGMPVRDYVVFTMAMIQTGFAAWAMDQPGGELPPGVSMANVEFFRTHEAEFQEAASLVEPYECDDSGDDGYEDEAYEEGANEESAYEE